MALRVTPQDGTAKQRKLSYKQARRSLALSYLVSARQGNMISALKAISIRSTMGLPGWN